MMFNAHPCAASAIAAALACGAGMLGAQDYPARPIRFVTSAAGGGGDFTARLVAQGFLNAFGQQVIVDNRPTGPIQGQLVSQAPPDGYTLAVSGSSVWIQTLLRKNAGYDMIKDFAPVSWIEMSVNVAAVHPSVPVKSIKELIALARGRPGELSYGSAGVGGAGHLATELFNSMAGIKVVHVPYKGAAQSLIDLMSGQVQYTFSSLPAVAPHMKTGRVRALAVTSAQPSALAPALPAIAAAGVPGYEAVSMTVMFAPTKTPPAIVNRLSQEIGRFVQQPDVKQKFFNAGAEVVSATPEETAAKVHSDIARMGKVIRDADIRAD
jgi:tripartite-type tricarboxylate transporter receptor subunit TctC